MTEPKIGRSRRPWIHVMLALALFCVFAVSALLYALFGARTFRNIAKRSDEVYAVYTPLAYLEGRMKSADMAGAVSVEQNEAGDVLCFAQELGGRRIETRIYINQGHLCELTALPGAEADPAFGEALLPLEKLSVSEISAGLFQITVQTGGGQAASALVFLRSSGR